MSHDQTPIKVCPNEGCYKAHPSGVRVCDECGYEFYKRRPTIEQSDALCEALQLGLDALNTLDYKATPANRAFVLAAREALRAAGVEPRA